MNSPNAIASPTAAAAERHSAELANALGSDHAKLQCHIAHYVSTKARAAVLRRRRSHAQKLRQRKNASSQALVESVEAPASDSPTTFGLSQPSLPSSGGNELVDTFLFDDCCPEYGAPGSALLNDGTLSLVRRIAGVILCLEISFVEKVNPIWSVPLRDVVNVRSWLNRQFLTIQNINTMPKINPRATTKLEQLWDFLGQFDTSIECQATILRAVPLELESRITLLRARVFTSRPGQQELSSMQGNHVDATLSTSLAELPAKVWAQQAEISRLNKSLHNCARDIRKANATIRDIRSECARLEAAQRNDNPVKAEVIQWRFDPDLSAIAPDSIEQASELGEEVRNAALRLVNAVENNAIVGPGVSERTLTDLQTTIDVLNGVAQDIQKERPSEHPENGKIQSTQTSKRASAIENGTRDEYKEADMDMASDGEEDT